MGTIAINCSNGLGTSQDQVQYLNLFDRKPQGLSFSEIRAIAKNNFLCKKALEFKSQTPVKNWREWKSITENPEDSKKIEELEKRLNLKEITEEAIYHMLKWGGCLVMIHTSLKENEYEQEIDLTSELDPNLEKVEELSIIPYLRISKVNIQSDINKRNYLKSESFTVRGTKEKIHASRVLVFKMATTLESENPINISLRNFFGFSIFEDLEPLIKLVEANNNTLLDLSMDSQRTVHKISDIESEAGKAGGISKLNEQIARSEFHSGNKFRSVIGGNDDLSILAKNIGENLALQKDNYLRLAGALGLPELLAFGKSLTGLSQNAKEYLDIYFTPIIEFQKSRLTRFLKPLDELLFSELGLSKEDQSYEWCSLMEMDDKEKEEIKSAQLDNLLKGQTLGVLSYEDAIKEVESLEIFENKVEGNNPEKQFSLDSVFSFLNKNEEKKEDESQQPIEKEKKKGFLSRLFSWGGKAS